MTNSHYRSRDRRPCDRARPARRGHKVTIVDPRPSAGRLRRQCRLDRAYRHHAARLAQDVAQSAAVAHGPARAPDNPAELSPWRSLHGSSRFLAAARPDRIERSIGAIRALNEQRPHQPGSGGSTRSGSSRHVRERGVLSVCRSAAAFKAAAAMALDASARFGIPVEILDRKRAFALEPALGGRAIAAHYPDGSPCERPRLSSSRTSASRVERGANRR